MASATKRIFNDTDKKDLLKDLGDWRKRCIEVCTKAPIGGTAYKLADKLIGDIDTAVEALTGDRNYLHAKAHSTR